MTTELPPLPVNCPPHKAVLDIQSDGTILMSSGMTLGPVAKNTGEWLHKWAEKTPDAVFIAEREGDGWREVTYAQALAQVRAYAGGLLARGMNADTPIAMMSGAGVDHGLLALAAQYVGVPTVPMAEQYALLPAAHSRLEYVINKTNPSMVFVDNAEKFAAALALPLFDDIEVVAANPANAPRKVTPLADLAVASDAVDAAYAKVGPDTVAKYLFTSGSTSDPKGVVTTQRMMCVNQAQLAAAMPFLTEKAPKILDWLPWNHVFGGSHNFNMMLANGGSMYIDDGRPVGKMFGRSLENLRMHPGTLSFNVPIAFKMLLAALREDAELRKKYFQNLDMIFYAGAGLPGDIWDGLTELSLAETGTLPLMTSSWGMTETAPATIIVHERVARSGKIGVAMAGVTLKLVPLGGGRYELRCKGPNIMTAYLNDPAKTAETFDEDGFLITGDAVKFDNPDDPDRGLVFDGRVSEDFKLMSGTWVQATSVLDTAMKSLAGMATHVVVTGHDRSDLGLLIFANPAELEKIEADNLDGALVSIELAEKIKTALAHGFHDATGSAKRVVRAMVLADPPSVAGHEITDKGSLNTRNIRQNRAKLIDRLYDDHDPATIKI